MGKLITSVGLAPLRSQAMRRYEIVNRKGCFDLFHPNQTQYLSSVRIYEGNERKYTVSLFDDNHFLLHDDARPEEIAWRISEYLERVFTSSREEEPVVERIAQSRGRDRKVKR